MLDDKKVVWVSDDKGWRLAVYPTDEGVVIQLEKLVVSYKGETGTPPRGVAEWGDREICPPAQLHRVLSAKLKQIEAEQAVWRESAYQAGATRQAARKAIGAWPG